MVSNINIISEFPDKHHTEISHVPYIGWRIAYYIGDYIIFVFYLKNNICYFRDNDQVSTILEFNIINDICINNDIYYIKLYNFEKIKELINNHTLSDEEKIAFKDFLYEPEFKLKFVD